MTNENDTALLLRAPCEPFKSIYEALNVMRERNCHRESWHGSASSIADNCGGRLR